MRSTYRVSPISETDRLMVRCATSSDDNGDNDQTQETQNLDRCSDDFGLTKEADVQQIDSQDRDQTDCDDDSRCEVCPVTYYNRCSRDFRGNSDGITISVRNGQSKSKSRINETSCEMRE
jgi:hypothetical protein